ncbi:ABC-2 family transporter protein [Patescibacteria group bacterium]|nr:ABC-2 family transporter protein [Patescibacteria group bacterium]
MTTIKKSFASAKSVFYNSLSDPSKFYSFFFSHLATALVFLIFWQAVFKLNPSFKGYTFEKMVLYYIVGSFFSQLTTSSAGARSIEVAIKSGKFSFNLLQPLNWSIRQYVNTMVSKLMQSTSAFIALIIITFIFNKSFLNLQTIFVFIIALFFAMTLNYFLYGMISILAFYVTEIWGIRSIFGRIADITSGKIFPLDILPANLFFAFGVLPFNYTHFFIMQIYLGKYNFTQSLQQITIQFLWILVTISIYAFFYKKGIKHYDSVGI